MLFFIAGTNFLKEYHTVGLLLGRRLDIPEVPLFGSDGSMLGIVQIAFNCAPHRTVLYQALTVRLQRRT